MLLAATRSNVEMMLLVATGAAISNSGFSIPKDVSDNAVRLGWNCVVRSSYPLESDYLDTRKTALYISGDGSNRAKASRTGERMTHVVTQPCDGCRYTDCVVVCPVECFYEGETMLYIHPDECIDCEACVPECPVEAIFHEDDVPEEWQSFVQLNADKCEDAENITERKEPLKKDD